MRFDGSDGRRPPASGANTTPIGRTDSGSGSGPGSGSAPGAGAAAGAADAGRNAGPVVTITHNFTPAQQQ
jgi:hypothetical protein